LFPRVCLIRLNLLNMLLIIVLDLGLNFSHFVVIFCSVLDDMALMLMMFSLTSLVTFVMLHTLSSKFTPERISMKIRIYNQVAGMPTHANQCGAATASLLLLRTARLNSLFECVLIRDGRAVRPTWFLSSYVSDIISCLCTDL